MQGSPLGNYLFIDGNYFRRAYEDTMRQVFPAAAVSQRAIDFGQIKRSLSASKAFYYDTVDEEASDAADRRAFIDGLSSLDGFHVREGTLSRDKKRQKQVDVALAVDCLTHAFNKNVWHVSLIAGDLDFKPLVDALITAGVHVHVVYEPRSGNRRLYRAADVAVPVNVISLWNWSTEAFRTENPCPHSAEGDPNHQGTHLEREGVWGERTLQLWRNQQEGTKILFSPGTGKLPPLRVKFHDEDRLKKYFTLVHGEFLLEPQK